MTRPITGFFIKKIANDRGLQLASSDGVLAATASPPHSELYWDGDSDGIITRDELIKGLIPAGEVTLLAGQSGAGKTYIAIDLAVALATGEDFFAHKVRQKGGTLFLLGEGAGTMAERLEAVHRGKLADNIGNLPIAWHALNGSLSDPGYQKHVFAIAKRAARKFDTRFDTSLKLIVIDTLAAAFALNDENDAATATAAMKVLQRLHVETGALVIAVSHYGKSAETGVRGSSAFTASADSILAVHAERDAMTGKVSERSIALTKSRWRDTGWNCGFELESVKVGRDEDGEDVWSAYVEPGEVGRAKVKQAKTPRGATQLIEAFNRAVSSRGVEHEIDGVKTICVSRDHLRVEFYKHYPADNIAAKGKAFARAEQTIGGAMRFENEWYSLVQS